MSDNFFIDIKRKEKVIAELRESKTDNLLNIDMVTDLLLDYTKDHLDDDSEENEIVQKIYPILIQMIDKVAERFFPQDLAHITLEEDVRAALTTMMMSGFLLKLYIDQNDLYINSIVEPITEKELDSLRSKSRYKKLKAIAAIGNTTPKELLTTMKQKGFIGEKEFQDVMDFIDKEEDNE